MGEEPVHLPQGACRQPDGSVLWRVWAPHADRVTLVLHPAAARAEIAMQPAGAGYFVHREAQADEGLRYVYRLSDGKEYPDPASRWQPDGVHGPSAVFTPGAWHGDESDWHGVPREELVIYELHVGTFTAAGTFDAVVPRLPALRELGITAIEIMPVAQFPGDRGWGYDGVYPYAAQASYGGPQGLQRLVAAAHRAGLGVILDVVYNHLGPEGNYAACFGPYFTDRYRTPWGHAVNFDGPDSDAVRQFLIDNACYWVRDFHVDGLRLDAVQTIFDLSATHFLADLAAVVHAQAARQKRTVHLIAETNQNDTRLIDAPEQGGWGLDGLWSDDFHHSVHALLTGQRDGYYQDFGRAQHLAKAYQEVFVYDGCYSPFRRRRHGRRVGDRDRTQFVVCVQNHDQVGNRARGDRFGTLLAPEAQRLACALLLLSPCTPLVFMGEEYGELRPFPFFCSFSDPELVAAVRRGRREEFAALAFQWETEIPDPQDPETFQRAKLSWQWPAGSLHAGIRCLYATLLGARRRWPALRDRQHTRARLVPVHGLGTGAFFGPEMPSPTTPTAEKGACPLPPAALLILERGGAPGVLAVANLTAQCASACGVEHGERTLVLSSEEPRFGGARALAEPRDTLLPYELCIFGHRDTCP
jgi:maltooligosyltrehalose trehalohydrolase